MPNALITDPQEILLNDHIQLDAMLGNPPTWMMRFGVWAVFSFVVLLFGLGWVIQYPDVVEAKVILVTENPPIRVLARVSGRVQHLLVKNEQTVQKGQHLAVLDNTADWQDVLRLETLLEKDPLSITLPQHLKLGTLQSNYSTFSQNLKDYRYFVAQTGVEKKIDYLNKQINDFPSRQYGILEGTVTSLAAVPQKEEYALDIRLPSDLQTTYGKPMPFRQEMQGIAKIVTEDRRVIMRLFDQFRDLLKNQK